MSVADELPGICRQLITIIEFKLSGLKPVVIIFIELNDMPG